MASIEHLIERAMLTQAGLAGGRRNADNRRVWFGGTKTSMRRAKCLAYARRQHRRLGKPGPFFFTVTRSIHHDPRTGRAIQNHGVGQVIGFVTEAERTQGIRYLKAQGYVHFTAFRDVNATFALAIAKPSEQHMSIGGSGTAAAPKGTMADKLTAALNGKRK